MPTQDYFGTKRVQAWPQNKDPAIIASAEGYAVMYEDGYTSWSPRAVFEKAYQPITSMGFGHAIAALKAGEKVARVGWNGKRMYVWLEDGSSPVVYENPLVDRVGGVSANLFHRSDEDTSIVMPHLCMRAADGSRVVGWLASQTDILAEDWMIVE